MKLSRLALFVILLHFLGGCVDQLTDFSSLNFCPGIRDEDGSCPSLDQSQESDTPIVWSLSDSSKYIYDSELIEINNNGARLKLEDQRSLKSNLSQGTYSNSYLEAEKIQLFDSVQASVTHVNTILTDREDDLILYQRYDGTFENSGKSSNTANVQGGAGLSTSFLKNGSGSLSLDGDGDYLNLGDVNEFDSSNRLTVCAWVYHKSTSNDDYIVSNGHSSGDGRFLFLRDDYGNETGRSDTYTIFVSDGHQSAKIEGTNGISPLGRWTHVCTTFRSNSSSGLRLYINGREDSSSPVSTSNVDALNSGSRNLLIGSMNTGSHFNGHMDEVVIYKAALSADEIAKIYNVQNSNLSDLSESWTPKWSDIVGHWKMDGNWRDSSISGYNGSVHGNSSFSTKSQVGSFSGKFSSSGDYISTSAYPVVDGNPRTVAAWVKTTAKNNKNTIVDWGDTNNGERFNFQVRDAGVIRVENQGLGENGTISVSDGFWHHVAVSCSGANLNTCKLYVDGRLDKQVTANNPIKTASGGSPLRIGSAASYNANFIGSIDDLTIWKSALTDSEISLIYNRQKQAFVGSFQSAVLDLNTTSEIDDIEIKTEFPFMKEFAVSGNESESYSGLSDEINDFFFAGWSLNEEAGVSGNNASEIKENFNGEIVGGVTSGVQGILGNSYFFDGSSGYINAGLLGSFGSGITSGATLCSWLRTSNSDVQSVIGNYDGTSPNGTTLQLQINRGAASSNINGSVFAYIRHAGGSVRTISAYTGIDSGFTDGRWHHLCAIYSITDKSITIILDGKALAVTYEKQQQLSNFVDFNRDLYIGANNAQGTANRFFSGYLDNVMIFNKNLGLDDVRSLYRRGANRVKYQFRACSDSSCSGDPDWKGPGGDGTSYFSELYNRETSDLDSTFSGCYVSYPDTCSVGEFALSGGTLSTPFNFSLSDFPSYYKDSLQTRYLQYRVLLEAEDNTACGGSVCLPSFDEISFGLDSKYFTTSPSITSKVPKIITNTITSIEEEVDGDCSVKYQFSTDGTSFYYFDSGTWKNTTSNHLNSNTADQVGAHLNDLIGAGILYFRAYLISDGEQSCRLKTLKLIQP